MKTLIALFASMALLVACAGSSPTSPSVATAPADPASTAVPSATPAPTPQGSGSADAGWIAYQRWTSDGTTRVALSHADGSDDHIVPIEGTPSGDLAHVTWAPDGMLGFDVFFDDPATPGKQRVEPWIAGVDGGSATQLAGCELPCLQHAYPAWSPDATRIAVLRYDLAEDGTWGRSALEIIDASTGDRQVVAETADGLEAWYFPRWSPDGESIVVVGETYTDSAQGTYVGMWLATIPVGDDPDGQATVTRLDLPDLFPREVDWGGPDGRLVVSAIPNLMSPIADARIVTMRPDGSDLQPVLGAAGPEVLGYQPSWDPVGEGIVFTSVAGGQAPTLGVLVPDAEPAFLPDLGWPRTHGRIQPAP